MESEHTSQLSENDDISIIDSNFHVTKCQLMLPSVRLVFLCVQLNRLNVVILKCSV